MNEHSTSCACRRGVRIRVETGDHVKILRAKEGDVLVVQVRGQLASRDAEDLARTIWHRLAIPCVIVEDGSRAYLARSPAPQFGALQLGEDLVVVPPDPAPGFAVLQSPEERARAWREDGGAHIWWALVGGFRCIRCGMQCAHPEPAEPGAPVPPGGARG